jgi:glycosyltransferase involved in cell wall biosynthesis
VNVVSNSLLILVGLALVVTLAYRLERSLYQFRMRQTYKKPAELPSVSICIPARNETHAMTQCLERVLASDYPKMEVVVFDDGSADDTSILIKSFAHAGVRFIPGSELPQGWLGKNYALETLAREASGTYIMFMDVDTHIQTTTISQLVSYMVGEDLRMLSVIPGRNDIWRPSVLLGHLRYFWEIVLSRASAPATASSLWMIHRRTLMNTIAGFRSHKAEVEPEEHLAAIIGPKAYQCLVNDKSLGVTYEKRWQSQVETSRRLLYPMVGGTWQWAVLAGLGLLFMNIQTVIVIVGLATGWGVMQTNAVIIGCLFALIYGRYTYVLWRSNWWIGVLLWPIVILQELILLIASVVGYARRTITWKGRPVVSPRLAKQLEANENL